MKKDSELRWILIMGAVVAVGPMSIDMYLPSLPQLQAHFATNSASTQLTLAAFFVGLAIGQLLYGPLADRFGRKLPLLVGQGVYVLASLGCVFAPSIEALIGLRFIQALGGSAGMVICRAMVRDRYPPQEMARVMSLLVLVLGVAPILAPTVGGFLQQHFGWMSIFIVLVIYGVACLVLVGFFIGESYRGGKPEPLRMGSTLRGYLRLLSHRRFMGYALAGGVAQGGMFAYIAASPFVFMQLYGLSAQAYGWLFGVNAFGLIVAAQANRYLLKRLAAQRVLKYALRGYLCSAVVMLAMVVSGAFGVLGVMLPLWLCIAVLGFTFPNSVAAAMTPFGDRAGMASAMLGTLQFSVAGLAAVVVGLWASSLDAASALPMAGVIASCALISVVLLQWVSGPQYADDD